jgi:hypothetical protein
MHPEDGYFTDPGADTWTGTVDYGDGSGVQPLTLTTEKTFPISHVYTDNGTYTVTFTITDDDGGIGTHTATVTVNNVAPTATFNAPASVDEGSDIVLSLTAPYDPSSTDTAAGFEYAFDCGSGYSAWSSTSTASCPTTDKGTRNVKGQIKDKDGGVTEYTATVTINDVFPTSVSAGGPYTGTAGTPVAITGSATCVSVDACTFAWDLDGDTVYDDATGTSASYTWNTIGDYVIGLQVTDNDGNAVTATASVHITGATHSLSLVPGWNLVSFNLRPANTSIAAVLSSISGNYSLVYAWDATVGSGNWMKYSPTAPGYSNTLGALDEKMGFWIHMTSADTLDVVGNVPVTTDINLSTAAGGWNLVGYPSPVSRDLPAALVAHGVGTDFSLVYAYHASEPANPWKLYDRMSSEPYANDLLQMTSGWGYWIKVSVDHVWSVKYQAD